MYRSVTSPLQRLVDAALIGLVAAIAHFVLVAASYIRPANASEWSLFGLSAAIVFLLVALGAWAGRGGLAALWALLLLFWLFHIWKAFPADSFLQAEAALLVYRGLGIPNSFWGWSYVAAPVALATWAVLHRRGLASVRHALPVAAAWLVLLIIGRHMGGIAWDVRPPPYREVPTAYTMLALYLPSPIAFCAWMMYWLRRTRWPATSRHSP